MKNLLKALLLIAITIGAIQNVDAQSEKNKNKIIADAADAKEEFIKSDWQIKNHFSNAHGYVIFPNVGKGGIGIGGAAGNGVVYEDGSKIGMAKLSQLSIGFQWGGQAYREIIFFETQETMDRFKESKVELSAQASVVALKLGHLQMLST
jgi:lipid-binding SYLF domain-containing protein